MIPKFRAWDGGSLCRMYQPDEVMVGNGDIWIIDEDSVAGDWIVNNDLDLMQSTGLKDKNGKEIFEGDVVTFEDEIRCGDDLDIFLNIGVVEYGQGMFYISNRQSVCADDLLDGEMWDVEVIGNIYENQELIE